jgi:hypothetical protein
MSETTTAAASETTKKPAAKKAAKRKATKKPAAKAKRAAKSAGGSKAKGKGGKSSFVIWVDAAQAKFIKAKAAKAGMTQADYFRKALKLPPARS